MPIPFTCPHCKARSEVSDEYAGQTGPCSQCGKPITVGLPAAPAQYAPPRKRSSGGPTLVIVLVAVLGVVVVCGGILAALLLPAIQTAGGRARRAQCPNNLKQIGLAMHNYAVAYGCFPPAYTTDEDGNPLHSWRVLILPYMGDGSLYDMIDLEEPWDSPNNLALADMMPDIYRCPNSSANVSGLETNYAMIVGPGTISDGPTATKMADIEDGASHTIMVVEVEWTGINWMQPQDLDTETMSFRVNDPKDTGIGSSHVGGANVVFCDGSVHFLDDSIVPEQIEAMTTIEGGEIVSPIY